MLEIKNISKIYKVGTFGNKELHAVRNVSFNVKNGEIVSLIGESGSGKSTIGKMILRLTDITSGQINFDGVDISTFKGAALKDYYRKVQGVFQDPFSSYNPIFKADRIFNIMHEEFFPDMSGSDWETKLHESLGCVGLNPEHVLNKFPHQLSGGQLQRFLIARALLLETDFIVADEIISMLDASTRIDVLNLLAELKSYGFSVLFITHDLSLGYYISERAVILYRGCVVEMGKTDKIFNNPIHPYTQALMSSVPRLDKHWEEGSGGDLCTRESLGIQLGCSYYGRCKNAITEKCECIAPELIEVEEDHFVACHLKSK
jgi:peptide/nickel transport system ATP-binding protein